MKDDQLKENMLKALKDIQHCGSDCDDYLSEFCTSKACDAAREMIGSLINVFYDLKSRIEKALGAGWAIDYLTSEPEFDDLLDALEELQNFGERTEAETKKGAKT